MDDALVVRGLEALGDLKGDIGQLGDGQLADGEPLLQAAAFDKRHREKHCAIGRGNLMHRTDVRVIEQGGGTGFSEEPLPGLGRLTPGLGQQLERDRPPEPGIFGLEDDAHPAAADEFQQAVAAGNHAAGVVAEVCG